MVFEWELGLMRNEGCIVVKWRRRGGFVCGICRIWVKIREMIEGNEHG